MTTLPAGVADLVEPEVLNHLLDVVRHSPAGLFTDIDGTISPIAKVPTEATVNEMARSALDRLSRQLAIVGAVTGRAAKDGVRLIGLHDLLVVGNHGLEWHHRDEEWIHPSAEASRQAIDTALQEIGAAVANAGIAEGVLLEDKQLSASIHYRLSPEPIDAREIILQAASEAASNHRLRVTEGRFVVELRPEVVVNKGTAITELMQSRGLASVVYLGDDVTDVDAFVAIRTLRDEGRASTLSVAVLSPESHPSVEVMADVSVQGVDACVALLTALAASLDTAKKKSS